MERGAQFAKLSYVLVGLIAFLVLAFAIAAPAYADGLKVKYSGNGDYIYTSSNGIKWYCYEVILQEEDGSESFGAVIYGCEGAGPELSIPARVKDAVGNFRDVVGVVSSNQIYESGRSEFGYYDGADYIGIITFPDTVRFIGENAFDAMGNDEFSLIYEINLPNSEDLTIGWAAFRACGAKNTMTTTVNFGSNPVTLDTYAFACCEGIESLTLPQGSTISDEAFYSCSNIKSIVNAPKSMSLSGEGGGKKLESIVFDPALTEVEGVDVDYDENADSRFPCLTTVTLPPNCTSLGFGIFRDCPNLTTVNNLDWTKINEVGDYAFYGCKKLRLENVIWKTDDLTGYQFKDSGLVSITLPANLKYLYAGTFTGCPNLVAINVAAGNTEFSSVDGVLFCNSYKYDYDSGSYVKTGLKSMMKYPAGKNIGGSYTVPSNVETIGGFTFEGCRLSAVHIPITVEALLSDYMASLTSDTQYYPFDNTPDSLAVYVVKGSHADYDVQGLHSNIKYELGPSVPITYVLDGGTNASSNPSSFRAGNSITLAAPTRAGYVFKGWKPSWDDSAMTFPYQPDYSDFQTGLTFTAMWEKTKVTTGSEMKVAPKKTKYAYTGKAIKPALTVTVNGKAIEASNYTVTYENNKAIGKATVTVKGTGNYKDLSATAKFTINPAKVKSPKAVSKKTKTATVSWSKAAAAAKVGGYEIQLSTSKKFKKGTIVKTKVKAKKKSVTVKKLTSKKKYFVRIRAYKKVNGTTYNGSWSKVVKVTIK